MLSIQKLGCILIAALMCSAAMAQNISVSGNITDASTGEPVPYASVYLDGTQIGVSSDNEGHYSISVPFDGKLVFSSIGYRNTEVTVASSGTIDVELHQDSEFIDETIVVAYGTATRSSFTGSASMVGTELIAERAISNVTSVMITLMENMTANTPTTVTTARSNSDMPWLRLWPNVSTSLVMRESVSPVDVRSK